MKIRAIIRKNCKKRQQFTNKLLQVDQNKLKDLQQNATFIDSWIKRYLIKTSKH